MKNLILYMLLFTSLASTAQITQVSLQASGLTCSMCSNSIDKALRTLVFVAGVKADIKTYTFTLSFKPNSTIDFDLIKNKVEGAGFTVTKFVVSIHFDAVTIKDVQSITFEDKTFRLVNNQEDVLNGIKDIRILDKGFVSAKEFKKRPFPVFSPRLYNASIEASAL